MNFVINLDYKPSVPLYKRLSDGLKEGILKGRLAPGDILPSSRDLSITLKVSRSTVLKAINDLQDQGIINNTGHHRLFVNAQLSTKTHASHPSIYPQLMDSAPRAKRLSSYARRVLTQQKEMRTNWLDKLPQIDHGRLPPDLTPIKEWQRLTKKNCRPANISALLDTIQPFGHPPLQEALAAYLHKKRAVKCTANQIAIFSNKQLRFELIVRLFINPGDKVAIEEPGYPEARYMLMSHGADLLHIPTDSNGMDVDKLIALAPKVKFVYVTPSHQDPTGAVLSLERRNRLLQWAQSTGTFIIEDDYDSEYQFGRQTLPSIQSIDRADCVIYLASFSKILSGLINFGIVVLPKQLSSVAQKAKMEMERYLPLVEQIALADLINEGHLEEYVSKTHSTLSLKRQALIYALKMHLGNGVNCSQAGAGTHLLISLKGAPMEAQIINAARSCGLTVVSTAPYYVQPKHKNEFMLPFADIDPHIIETIIARWSLLLEEMSIV